MVDDNDNKPVSLWVCVCKPDPTLFTYSIVPDVLELAHATSTQGRGRKGLCDGQKEEACEASSS